jgi:S1-C subfamily serine protease
MLSEQMRRAIVQACVTIPNLGGRGVLVPGNLVLTAAHCVAYATDGAMVLGDYFLEALQTPQGVVHVTPLAVEPVVDIAVLGALDNQEFPEHAEVFETWCTDTPPVPLSCAPLPLGDPFSIYIPTHTGTWIQGSGQLARADAHLLWIETADQIEGGTSGSPIVTGRGELVGIVSHTSFLSGHGVHQGRAPRPHLTLPAWIVHQIQAASEGT